MHKLTEGQLKGTDGTLPTVLITTADGIVRINEHEFDPAKHKLFEGELPEPTQAQAQAQATEARRESETLDEAIASVALQSLPGGEYHGKEDYVVPQMAGHFKASESEVRAKLQAAVKAVTDAAAAAAAETTPAKPAKGKK
jgi:dihydroxyacetone kinase